MCLQHLTTSWPWIYVYMYMCMDCVSSTPFSQNRSSHWIQVYNKQMCSTVLVYAYGLFFSLWNCFVLSYKGENCLQVKWEVHNSLAFSVFKSYYFWEAGLDDLLNLEILVFNVSRQNVFMWAVTVGDQLLCHIAGYELVMCLRSPTDVPYWEKNSAGFNNCAFAMHGIQVSWKADPEIWVQGHLRKGQFKAQCLTWDKVLKCQILIFKKSSYIKYWYYE